MNKKNFIGFIKKIFFQYILKKNHSSIIYVLFIIRVNEFLIIFYEIDNIYSHKKSIIQTFIFIYSNI